MLWQGCAAVCGLIVLTSITGCKERSADQSTSAIIELTDANFQREVIESEQPVLVEFWAPWCQPCIEMMPAMEQLAREFSGRVKVANVRIDEHEDLAAAFDVEAPPAIILFRQGQVIKRRSGQQTADSLTKLVAAALGDGDAQAASEP